MMSSFIEDLSDQLINRLSRLPSPRVAVIGATPEAFLLKSRLHELAFGNDRIRVFDPDLPEGRPEPLGVAPWSSLTSFSSNIIVVASDAEKELLLLGLKLVNFGEVLPVVILAGTAHLSFSDPTFDELDEPALVRSYANGYPLTRVHIFQCLQAASANRLDGAIIELGAFKGGTTAWLARLAKRLNLPSAVIAFDSWDGFPPRRSILDLYTHDRCVFRDLGGVRGHLEPLGVELVPGDITETVPTRLANEPILLAFVDTDNYSPAKSALETISRNLVRGGAIVFDHYATESEYIYTIGERIAAKEVLIHQGLLQLQGTGVFIKI